MNILSKIVYPAVKEIVGPDSGITELVESPESPLFGGASGLNSVYLVRFIVIVEERVESEMGTSIRLLSDKAMSQKSSPFKTLGSLAEYIEKLVAEAKKN